MPSAGVRVVDVTATDVAVAHPLPKTERVGVSVRVPARLHLDRATIWTLVLGLLCSAGLSLSARSVRDHNERVLVRQRTREAAAVVAALIPGVQLPLTTATVIVESPHADLADFQSLFTPLTGAKGPFVSASLWSVDALQRGPLTTAGRPQELTRLPAGAQADFFRQAVGKPSFSVLNLLNQPERRLGYAVTVASPSAHYLVYAEQQQPQNGRVPRIASDKAFADLGYALYLGSHQDTASLIYASAGDKLPIKGRQASATVPFGNTSILIVMTPHKALGGSLMQRLPMWIAVLGAILTLLAATLVERLARRRKYAETLAGELNKVAAQNAELYEQQRDVAETLQHSLLPERVPKLPGVDIAGRFAAGTPWMEIGGDWYDVIETAPNRCVFVVGDVSGRGVRAGTIMAKLRYAVRAYAVAGDPPEEILEKLSKLLTIRDGHFATVLCGELDLDTRRITLANAGHLPPVLRRGDDAELVETNGGVPIGVARRSPYEPTTLELGDDGTLMTFTDGLVERRGESLDVGLGRVVTLMKRHAPSLDALMDLILAELQHGADDDTAMLGLSWRL